MRGQASVDYVALVALVALALAGATAVAMPQLPGTLAHELRVALCIVGGDVCRASDAQAAGLEPCVLDARRLDDDSGASFGVVRLGGGGTGLLEHRSDGTYRFSVDEAAALDASAGPSFGLGPFAVGGHVGGEIGFRRGRVWDLPDERALGPLIVALIRGSLHNGRGEPPPTWRYSALERRGEAQAALSWDGDGAQQGATVRQAIGRRTGPDGTTWFFDLDASAGGPLGLAGAGHVLAEIREGAPPLLTLRRSAPAGDGRVVERVARLALDDAGDRAAVHRFVLAQAAGPAGLMLGRSIAERGTVETDTYVEERHDSGHTFNVGPAGVDESRTLTIRRLVSAVVAGNARRADCLGL